MVKKIMLNFYKLNAVPTTWVADSIYFIKSSPATDEMYVTNNSAVPTNVGNTTFITSVVNPLINTALADFNAVEIAANIAARNALAVGKIRNFLVLVTDATGDATVASGAALYVWKENTSLFEKLTEFEGLDISLTWNAISGKPTSSPTQIDNAVTNSHTHANKTFLDKIGETGGAMTYNGSTVGAVWTTTEW